VDWRLTTEEGRTGLLVQAREKTYAPPFLMLGLNIQNTTSEDFVVQLAGRYLAFDTVGSGSELRLDAAIGADPSLAGSLYRPLGGSRLFARGTGILAKKIFNFVVDDAVLAQYSERRAGVAGEVGINLSRVSELSGGFYAGHLSDSIRAGNPGLPELSGAETILQARWVVDEQDSPVVPSHGVRALARFDHTFASPEVPELARTNKDLTQLEAGVSSFYSPGKVNRLFVVFSGGTSFDHEPLPTRQFTLGFPYMLDAFGVGERRGDHYAVATVGALRQVGRLPDFLGGPIFLGGWLENGSAFNTHENADINTQIGLGVMIDTIVGPVLVGAGIGLDGGWRTIVGVGRIFR
jgi:NTE family protein